MEFLRVCKSLMVVCIPFIIVLASFNFYAFRPGFYREEFSKYNVYSDISRADFLNLKVLNFINGKANDIPGDFGIREKQHLQDVRRVVLAAKAVFYISLMLFFLLLIMLIKNSKKKATNFLGKILISGGLLTVALAGLVLLTIRKDFSNTFETFHRLLFSPGTYLFDPSTEIIVRLYPEQIFTDIGSGILLLSLAASAALIIFGSAMIFFKTKKNKNINNLEIYTD